MLSVGVKKLHLEANLYSVSIPEVLFIARPKDFTTGRYEFFRHICDSVATEISNLCGQPAMTTVDAEAELVIKATQNTKIRLGGTFGPGERLSPLP